MASVKKSSRTAFVKEISECEAPYKSQKQPPHSIYVIVNVYSSIQLYLHTKNIFRDSFLRARPHTVSDQSFVNADCHGQCHNDHCNSDLDLWKAIIGHNEPPLHTLLSTSDGGRHTGEARGVI